jgi:hypothetical protein
LGRGLADCKACTSPPSFKAPLPPVCPPLLPWDPCRRHKKTTRPRICRPAAKGSTKRHKGSKERAMDVESLEQSSVVTYCGLRRGDPPFEDGGRCEALQAPVINVRCWPDPLDRPAGRRLQKSVRIVVTSLPVSGSVMCKLKPASTLALAA